MRDELDQILVEAIKSYAAIEPPTALPARILRQAKQEPAPQHNRWKLALTYALPLAAALALAVVMLSQSALPKPPTIIASVPPAPSVGVPEPALSQEMLAAATSKPAPVPTQRHAHTVQRPRSWARPLPAPYSKEELALLTFVQQHPKEAAEIAKAQTQQATAALQPIAISPIQIKPITIAALN